MNKQSLSLFKIGRALDVKFYSFLQVAKVGCEPITLQKVDNYCIFQTENADYNETHPLATDVTSVGKKSKQRKWPRHRK